MKKILFLQLLVTTSIILSILTASPIGHSQPTPVPEVPLIIIVSFIVMFSGSAIIFEVRNNKQR